MYIIDFCLELTNYAFQIPLLDFVIIGSTCRWIDESFWKRKPMRCCPTTSIGQKMRRDVERLVQRCATCHKAKSKLTPYGLYTPLHS
jgi:hypothetical protein